MSLIRNIFVSLMVVSLLVVYLALLRTNQEDVNFTLLRFDPKSKSAPKEAELEKFKDTTTIENETDNEEDDTTSAKGDDDGIPSDKSEGNPDLPEEVAQHLEDMVVFNDSDIQQIPIDDEGTIEDDADSNEPGESDNGPVEITLTPNATFDDRYQLFIPQRAAPRPRLLARTMIEEHADPPQLSCNFSNPLDQKKWEICDPPKCSINATRERAKYERKTAWGENAGVFVDRVLRKAWGPDPPVIDLYVRSFCPGFSELSLMLESIEVFWPRFLGHVLIVLDYGNEEMAAKLLPKHLRSHSYRVIYEHGHCMHGRVYSQYSYLAVGRHSKADYIVTFDSDCAFFHPVTPDLLFTKYKRKMIMPTSQKLVTTTMPNSNFDKQQFFFTRVHDGTWGSAMVTQPISFKLSTFSQFMSWIKRTRGLCYEVLAARFARSTDPWDYRRICWMCQMGVFVALTGNPDYDIHTVNHRRDPYLRFATHYQYELYRQDQHFKQVDVVSAAIQQGLCVAFGEAVFPICKKVTPSYVTRVRTHYAYYRLNTVSTDEDIREAEHGLFSRLRRATDLAMKDTQVS